MRTKDIPAFVSELLRAGCKVDSILNGEFDDPDIYEPKRSEMHEAIVKICEKYRYDPRWLPYVQGYLRAYKSGSSSATIH